VRFIFGGMMVLRSGEPRNMRVGCGDFIVLDADPAVIGVCGGYSLVRVSQG